MLRGCCRSGKVWRHHDSAELYPRARDLCAEAGKVGRNKPENLKEWQGLMDANINVVVIDTPYSHIRKYQELDGINQLIMDLVLQLLS